MTTSAPIPSTCYQVICDAMVDAGKIGVGKEPNSEALTENMRRLNKYVNYLQTQGTMLWVQEDITLKAPALKAGVNQYAIGPAGVATNFAIVGKPRRIIEGYYVDSAPSATRRPLDLISRQEFDSMSTVTQTGTITAFYVDKQVFNLQVSLWMTPDAQAALGEVHFIIDLQIPNFAMLTDAMYFPSEWALALEWGLADQLSTGMPQEIVERCAAKSLFYETALLAWDQEDASTTFQPDPRGGYTGKRVGRY